MADAPQPDVLVARGDIVTIASADIQTVKDRARQSPRQRARICAHQDASDALHEMFIVLARTGYIRPHKHLAKCESFHMVQGEIDVVLFHDDGKIRQWLRLGDPVSGQPFFYRLSAPYFHTVLCNTEYAVVHEVTMGPFRKEDAIFADWAPREDDPPGIKSFLSALQQQRATFLKG